MALSDQEEFLWDRTRLRFCATVTDLPTVNPSGMWNPGDMVQVVPPSPGGVYQYVCVSSTNPSSTSNQGTVTWEPMGVVGQGTYRTVASPTTIVPGDNYVVVTSAGAVTLPTASTMAPFSPVNIIAQAGPVTVTPATGVVAGAAALTIAANQGFALVPSATTFWWTVVGAS